MTFFHVIFKKSIIMEETKPDLENTTTITTNKNHFNCDKNVNSS